MKGLSGFKKALKYLLRKSVVPMALAKGSNSALAGTEVPAA